MNVHSQDHCQAGGQPEAGIAETRNGGAEPEPGLRVLAGGPGCSGDYRGRRFAPGFRDEERTITVIGGGPTAAAASVAELARFPAIAVNDGYRLHPSCEAVYAADRAWWKGHIQQIDKTCSEATRRFCPDDYTCRSFGLEFRAVSTRGGLSRDHFTLNAGGAIGNSGAQAINLAWLAGARRILLVGFDMARGRGKDHWFGDHPDGIRRESPYHVFVQGMWELARDLAADGVQVLNASPDSQLKYWPRITTAELENVCRAPTS